MSWQRGHAEIQRLIADGELEQVAPSAEVAGRLVADADAHIGLASKGTADDPAGALQLSYDAARKAAAPGSPTFPEENPQWCRQKANELELILARAGVPPANRCRH